MAGSPQPFRRTAIVAGVVGVATIITALSGPGVVAAQAGTPATVAAAGTAGAIAQSYKVNPTTAALSIGFTFGISLADYTNTVARAESRAIDLGIIGSTLAGAGCDGSAPSFPADQQPQPVRADSRDPKAAAGYSQSEMYAPFITKAAKADSTPFSQADTTTASIGVANSAIVIEGAHSKALTHMVNGTRESVATVDIGSVNVAGLLKLAGLHWSASYQSGAIDKVVGAFTIGSLNVLGTALPTTDALNALSQANTLLAPLGLKLVLPQIHTDSGILFVDPLSVAVVPSPTRDGIVGTLLQNPNVQNTRQSLFDALLAQSCKNATYITVFDIALGSVTGAGSFSIDLGGVQAHSGALKTTNFLVDLPPLPSPLAPLPTLSAAPSSSVLNASIDLPTTTAAPPRVALKPTIRRRTPAVLAAAKGSRGGRLALVGGIGLLALLLVAERDRRLMRRAQRATPLEG